MAKRYLKTSSILSGLVIKLAIVLLILLVAGYLNLRLDFSQNKIYTLSSVSKEAVKGLKDNMVLKIYASEELPPGLSTIDRYLRDLLSEFKLAGKGKFHYEYVRGLSAEELKSQALQNGLKPMLFQIYENDETTTKEIVYGIVFEFQGNILTMQVKPGMEPQLEYSITQMLQKLGKLHLPQITVYADTLFARMPTDNFSKGMDANFGLKVVDLTTPPEQTEVMVFTGASADLSPDQLYNLDQYLMKGGSLVVLQDRMGTDGSGIIPVESNIFPLLQHYGLNISKEVVLDVFCDQRGTGIGNSIAFPVYPVLRGSDHPITANIANIVIYLGSALGFNKNPQLKYTPILSSSSKSGLLPGPPYVLEDKLFNNPDPEVFNKPAITLGATLEGKFTSYFADKPELQKPGFVASTEKSRIVAFGDRELFLDSDKEIYKDRYYIVLNAVDWLLKRDSMISIRSRSITQSILSIPYYMHKKDIVWGDLAKTERRIKTGIKVVGAVLPSLILILAGFFMALRRKQMAGAADE